MPHEHIYSLAYSFGSPKSRPELNIFNTLRITKPAHEAVEIRICLTRQQALRKLFGFVLCADEAGHGLPLVFRPETGTIRLGSAEAPLAMTQLDADEDVEIRIFIDAFVVEVFVNNRQTMVAEYPAYAGQTALYGITIGAPTTLTSLEVWQMTSTTAGFADAQQTPLWQPRED